METGPVVFSLHAHPNPTNSGLLLSWQIIEEDIYAVTINDILGRQVRIVRNERMPVGSYSEFVGRNLPSGVYFAIVSNRDDRRCVTFTVIR